MGRTIPILKWTAASSEGSRAETDWEEGGKILFLNADNEGMVSRIWEKKEKKNGFQASGNDTWPNVFRDLKDLVEN